MGIFRELKVLSTPSTVLPLDPKKPLRPSEARKISAEKKPDWIKIRPPSGENYHHVKQQLAHHGLHTVCQEAHCPNLNECWSTGTATFMLGGDTCTRACRFCAVKTSRTPPPLNPDEPNFIAQSILELHLNYVVLTSVDRDDLPDGAAEHFAKTIRAIKTSSDGKTFVEALVPDWQGLTSSIETILYSGLDVYAHNVETVPRLQYRVRDPRATYQQSVQTLRYAKKCGILKEVYTKSALMLGLGETHEECLKVFEDLRNADVDILTIGQYLRPSSSHLPVEKFYTPEEFEILGHIAKSFGFLFVAAGPMVRSSYRAAEVFLKEHRSSHTKTPGGYIFHSEKPKK